MLTLAVTLDPAKVDPVPCNGRGELEPKSAILKMPAAAVASPVSFPLRNQPAHTPPARISNLAAVEAARAGVFLPPVHPRRKRSNRFP
jgi:hypothetical protein